MQRGYLQRKEFNEYYTINEIIYIIIYHKDRTISLVQIDRVDIEKVKAYRWGINSRGYVVSVNNYKNQIYISRIILGITDPNIEIDHKDHNPFNNLKSNFRICTHAQNQRNKTLYRNNTSGYKGVNFNIRYQRWQAMITINGNRIWIGSFNNADDAARAYDQAAKKYHGEFACLNFKYKRVRKGLTNDESLQTSCE